MRSLDRRFVRTSCLSAVGLTLALALSTTAADARRHAGHHHHARPGAARHHFSLVDSPAFSAMVVDAGTGRTLYANHENELRHPASITKVMTLYLLFEKLDSGQLSLDSRISVSRHAASMAPTKLGLRPGSTIVVQDAIKAIVTKSANDMAVAVAEAVAGDEQSFAAMMTRKAHALGMSRTVYVNASGLPDDRQLTSARDLVTLGRSIRERFPQYYHFFSIPSFTYAGEFMPNHNHLMARVEGMDGIKTGYTRASGFNLLSSVNRGSHHLISVVLGGHSAASRDNIMASLIEDHIEDTAPTRLADAPPPAVEEPAPTVASYGRRFDPDSDRGAALIAPTMGVPAIGRPNDRARTPGQVATGGGSPIERARPAFVAGAPRFGAGRTDTPDERRLAQEGSTAARSAEPSSTPSTLRPPANVGRPVMVASLAPTPMPVARPEMAPPRSRSDEDQEARAPARDRGHGEWIIQVGATDAPDKATELLSRAKSQGSSALASARPFTEKVRKGDSTLYRARFAGLDTTEAEQACRALKRSGFACFATKD